MLRSLAAAFAMLLATGAAADEGMWTFDNVPQAAIQEKYLTTLDKPWLDKLQRSITRFESGCTGSFVSPDGLVLTNHHCAMSCLAGVVQQHRELCRRRFQRHHPRRREEMSDADPVRAGGDGKHHPENQQRHRWPC